MIVGNDGGVDISLNGGETWYAPPLPISQFYRIGVDTRNPYHVSGTMQDLGSIAGPEQQPERRGIALSDWYDVGGGETGYTVPDPTDPNIVYAGEYAGVITRYDHRTRQARMVSGYVDNPSGHGAADMKYRFRWPAPIAGSPHDPKVIYHAANVLFRTSDGGQTWTAISGDLTRNDKRRQQWSGGPITGDNTTAEYYCTISAVAESPKEKGLIWVGSDDGLVHVTRDARQDLDQRHREPARPAGVGHDQDDRALAVRRGRGLRRGRRPHARRHAPLPLPDPRPWQDVELLSAARCPRTFPSTSSARTRRRRDSSTREPSGAWCSRPTTARAGNRSSSTCPTVPVHDLIVKGNDLVVGTHGRSLWIFDDLTPIRPFGPAIAAKAVDVLAPACPPRGGGTTGPSARRRRGENPPAGSDPPPLAQGDAQGEAQGRDPRRRGEARPLAREGRTEPEPIAGRARRCRRQGAGRGGAGGQGKGRRRRRRRKRDRPERPRQAEDARRSRDCYRVVWNLELDPAARSRTPRSIPAARRSVRWPCPGSTR